MTRRGNAPPAGRREIEVEAMSDQIAQFFREHNIQEVEAIVLDISNVPVIDHDLPAIKCQRGFRV